MTHKSKWYAVNTEALAYGLFNLPKPLMGLTIFLQPKQRRTETRED
jgi:hypothetical protein